MKTNVNFLKSILVILGLTTLLSCSKDDNPAAQVSAADLSTTILENPQAGTSIGTIAVSDPTGATFTITSSDPSGAFSVNSNGEVTVADEAAFDYELRTSVNATVSVMKDGQETTSNIAVNLLDADDLLTLLTTSKQAYEDETSGWVEITETEYNKLVERLQDVEKAGVSDTDYNMSGEPFQTAGGLTVTNSNNIAMDPGTYFFAFRYYAVEDNSVQVRPKVSEQSPTSGYVGRGPLPEHDAGDRFFVSKGENYQVPSTSFLGLYSPNSMGWRSNSANEMYYRFGNGSSLTNGVNGVQVLIQGLTTTVKQWD